MILRDYQQRAVAACLPLDRVVLVGPTGSGKTLMGVAISRAIGGRCCWVAHRRELVLQAVAALRDAGEEPGIIMPGEPSHPDRLIQVCSVQTLARRGMPPCELCCIDEAHHVAAASYANLTAPRMLGLTATPFRLDGSGLRPPFEHIVVAATTAELCRDGTLIEPEVYAPPAPNLRGIRSRCGDYELRALGERMTKLVGNPVRHWFKLARGRPTVAFAVNCEHSRALVQAFLDAGVPAEHIDASSTPAERDSAYQRLASGQIKVVSNVGLWTEGMDLPSLEVAIIARPTQSLGLHLQAIGRIMRACPGKAGSLCLDHAGNHERHGTVTRRIDYSLDGIRLEPRPAWHGLGRCPKCYMLLDADWTKCPACGAERPRPQIKDYTSEELVRGAGTLATEEVRREFYEALEERRKQLGYRPGWSAYRYKARFGIWPEGSLASQGSQEEVLRSLCKTAAERGYKWGWVAWRFKARFGTWPSARVRAGAAKTDRGERTGTGRIETERSAPSVQITTSPATSHTAP